MLWSWIAYGALEIVTLFIILERLQQRRELGYEPVLLAKEPVLAISMVGNSAWSAPASQS